MAKERQCSKCGGKLPADAPQGLCPQCLMKLGLPTGADADKAGSSDNQSGIPTNATPPGRFVPPEPKDLAEKFPQLEIIELLGQGGMGAVYKARQKQLDRLVALKILPPEVGQDPAFAERFTREARSMAMLNHPHIVTIHEFGQTEDGLYYFIMEFVDGTDLRRVIQAGELSPNEALAIVPQICEALQYAHEEGIVHRDIKPENVLLDKKGRVKIADFGLARLLDRPATAYTLTQAGQRMGTPHYMAPEQIEHPHEVDHRADIYSLGVVFYEMLTGQLPIGQFAPPSQKVQVDVRLDEIVLKTLENKPERRYQHASEVKTDVETIAHVAPPPKSPPADVELPAEQLQQLVLSQLPATKAAVIKIYREKTGASLREAFAAVEAIARKHGIQFTPVPLWRRHLITAIMVMVMASYFVFRGYVDLSPIIAKTIYFAWLAFAAAFFVISAWRQRGTEQGRKFAFMAVILFFLIAGIPVLDFFGDPKPILERLYDITGSKPGQHDVLFFRILFVAVIAGTLAWLLRFLRRLRTKSKATAGQSKLPKAEVEHTEAGLIRQQVKRPAIGLLVTGILNWVGITVAVLILTPIMASKQRAHPDPEAALWLVAVIAIVFSGLIIFAALKMMRLEAYPWAIAGSILAMITTPGNIIGLPIGVWTLVVLSSREVKAAFPRKKRVVDLSRQSKWNAFCIAALPISLIGILFSVREMDPGEDVPVRIMWALSIAISVVFAGIGLWQHSRYQGMKGKGFGIAALVIALAALIGFFVTIYYPVTW